MRPALLLTTCLLLAGAIPAPGWEDDDDDDRKRMEREIRSLARRAERLPRKREGSISSFFHKETEALFARAQAARPGSHEARRLLEAIDDFIDAREALLKAARDQDEDEDSGKDDKADTARRLERVYFRVQQGDYFARLSETEQAPEYLKYARQFYQRARTAYDRGKHYQAEKLAEVSEELVNTLENLAQATVRIPDPPRLK